jgi:hypothetical protein
LLAKKSTSTNKNTHICLDFFELQTIFVLMNPT